MSNTKALGYTKMSAREDWTKEELKKEYVGKMTAVTIAVNMHIEGQQRILDLSEMKKVIKEAKLISLGDCGCRKDLRHCDAPLDVCIGLDEKAQSMIKKGLAKEVSLSQALEAFKRSNAAGLVHIAYTFKGDEKPVWVCSCCSCCCHSLSALVRFGIPNAVVTSNHIAVNDPETCISCGTCVERCQFKARNLKEGRLVYNKARCFGCGVCVSTCSTGSISLVRRS